MEIDVNKFFSEISRDAEHCIPGDKLGQAHFKLGYYKKMIEDHFAGKCSLERHYQHLVGVNHDLEIRQKKAFNCGMDLDRTGSQKGLR
jgi:hypothetical protein